MSDVDDATASTPNKAKRERSTKYPGVPLAEAIELCRFVESRGLNGLTATDIALAQGYKNIKTNTFSGRLSAARQFGLLILKDEGYSLTPLAKSILHPVDPNDISRPYRQALLEPPLYRELAELFHDKRMPEASILGNVLYNKYQIIATAKQAAAEAFLDSARFAGALSDDHVLHPGGIPQAAPAAPTAAAPSPAAPAAPAPAPGYAPAPAAPGRSSPDQASDVRIDLRLWDADLGKSIRVRAPEVITPASFDRLIQTLRLQLRIEEPPPAPEPGPAAEPESLPLDDEPAADEPDEE